MRGMEITICDHLRGLYEYELAHGNVVSKVGARPECGFDCAVVFDAVLKIWATPATGSLPAGVSY